MLANNGGTRHDLLEYVFKLPMLALFESGGRIDLELVCIFEPVN